MSLTSRVRPVAAFALALLLLAGSAAAQTASSAKQDAPKGDHTQEAFVIEQFSRKQRFENDGTEVREDAGRVRIQSEAGVQQYGLLTFSYASGTGTFDIEYLRVRKPDGTVVETPPENIQDMAAQITREAPFYSDLHEKHAAVKGLSVGDVLEYKISEHTTKPLAPGQFWASYRFTTDQIVLDEVFEISVPRDRPVKIKSATVQPAISEAAGYRIYTWRHSNLQHKDETHKKRNTYALLWQQARGRLPQPDVLMSSFKSWEEVGRWYSALQDERVKPTDEVKAKAAELTKNAATDEARLRALYAYVGTQFHYIGVDFGIGRYQPHSAADVLANQYGDCKDKHTLLASLLAAVGIPAYPALISSSHEVDADVPSPGQFDHVITAVPREGGLVWLDTTAEVGPYQYLLSNLRDKHALVAWKDKPPALMATPADLPYPMTQTFSMVAKLDEAGTLVGQAEVSSRGDVEFLLRRGFRATPLPQWKDLVQQISMGSGFAGEVSEVTASSTEKTDEAFHFSYKYTRKDFGDWPNHRILAPEPFISLPAPDDEELLPLGPSWLGPLTDIRFSSQVEIPPGYRAQLPQEIHLKKDFAQFDVTYEFKDGKLISERHLKTLMTEAPASQREQYKQFVKTVQDDYGVYIQLSSGSGTVAATVYKNPQEASMSALMSLPDSANAEAVRLENEAHDALAKSTPKAAIYSLYRAVSEDPKFARAWFLLGLLLLDQKEIDAGEDAFHKAVALEPKESAIPKALGWGLMAASRFDDAVPVWQDYVKTYPDDHDGPANLASCFFQMKRYAEAAEAYEQVLKTGEKKAILQSRLASTYLLAGQREKAGEAFSKLEEMNPEASNLNDAAYQMANADLKLPLALNYARIAVSGVEMESQKITLPDLKEADLRIVQKLSAYWDTLGWANERLSNLPEAEAYLRASWKLTQDGTAAGHLCHLYKRTHQIDLAIQMCQLAVHRIPMTEGFSLEQYKTELAAAQENLKQLTTAPGKSSTSIDASNFVIRERTFKLARFLPGTESAEFFVLLASDGKSKTFKVEDTKFISGSSKMKLQGKQLKAINFNFPDPGNSPARFVWRGILGCYQYSGCSFVLLDPAAVHSVN